MFKKTYAQIVSSITRAISDLEKLAEVETMNAEDRLKASRQMMDQSLIHQEEAARAKRTADNFKKLIGE